jgi:hypothetical protein
VSRIFTTVDDIDGSSPASTVFFGLDEKNYKIDLSEENKAELRGILELLVEHGRPGNGARVRRYVPPPLRHDHLDARRWAEKQGFNVPKRGRLATHWFTLYDARVAELAAEATQEQSLVTPEGGSNVLPTP